MIVILVDELALISGVRLLFFTLSKVCLVKLMSVISRGVFFSVV